MEILTREGYKHIDDIQIGDEIVGKNVSVNRLLAKTILDKTWFEEQGFPQDWKWYLINGTYRFFHHQNIFVSRGYYNLCHVFELEVGWCILGADGNEIEITSIEEAANEEMYYKLDVSGDHSFITQNVNVHNASRYWVGGGSSANWNATGNTNWSATSGGSNNASVPGAADDVLFDGAGVNGNTNVTISATITILSFTSSSGYTATITRNATLTVVNNFTLHKNTVWAGASGLIISGTSTITANGFSAGDTFWSNDLQFSGNAVKTLVSSTGDIKIGGTFSTPAISGTNTVNSTGVTFTVSGLSVSSTVLAGTAKIVLIGGTWSGLCTIANNLDLQGNITISGTVQYITGTLKYVSGTITTTGSTLQLNASVGNSVTLDCGSMTWANLSFNNINTGTTVTLSSNLNLSGNLLAASQTVASIVINGLFNLSVGGNFSPTLNSGSFSGTATIVMTGNGTLATNSATSGFISNNLTINASGTITLGTNFAYRTGTLTHTAGTVTSTGNTLNIGAATTINVNNTGFSLNNVTTTANTTFGGTNGFTIGGTYTCSTAGVTHTFASTRTYAITTLLLSGTSASRNTLKSSSAGSQAIINLTNISSNYNLNVTDIDGSGGAAGYTFGTVSNSLNWNGSTVLYWVSSGSSWTSNTNWSPASGGPAINIANFSPASTDAVAFDINSGNATVNGANRTVASVTFTGYTNTITLTTGLSSVGNITLGSSMNVAGTGFLGFSGGGNATYTSNGYTWPNEFRFTSITTARTYTLASDCSFSGTVTTTGNSNFTQTILTGGFTLSCNGTLTVAGLQQGFSSSGTGVTFKMTGGILGGPTLLSPIGFILSGTAGNIVIDSGVNTVTMIGSIGFTSTGGTFTYTSGVVDALAGGLGLGNPVTLNLGSNVKWGSITASTAFGSGTITLTNDLWCNNFSNTACVFTTGVPRSIYLNTYSGTVDGGGGIPGAGVALVFNGGSSNASSGVIAHTGSNSWRLIDIDMPVVTFTQNNFNLGGSANTTSFKITSGIIVPPPRLAIINSITLFNTPGTIWNNIAVGSNVGFGTWNLTSDIWCKTLSFEATVGVTLNNFNFYVDGSFGNFNSGAVQGTTTINLVGSGYWVHGGSSTVFTNPLVINTGGIYRLGSSAFSIYPNLYKNGNLNYIKGTVIARGTTLLVTATSAGWVNMHRIAFDTVTITGGTTQTMNEFFGGRPGRFCVVRSTNTTNVTIIFTDGFEKFARWVLPSNMTITQRGQLKLLSSKGSRNATNLGFIHFEGMQPYGIPHNNPIVYQPSNCFGIGDSPADPNFF